ncbi:MAG: hypothetical protein AAGI30_07415 [Planctomycetota bacterium]
MSRSGFSVATVVAAAGAATSQTVYQNLDLTLGFSDPAEELLIDINGDTAPDLVFRAEDGDRVGQPASAWFLGSFDIGTLNPFSASDPTSDLGGGSDTDDADFFFFRDTNQGASGLPTAIDKNNAHYLQGDFFDPSGAGSPITILYEDKDNVNSGQGSFDQGMMGVSSDGEIRYLGFVFSDPFQPKSAGIDANQKLRGWIAVQYNVATGPLQAAERDDSAITLLDFAYNSESGAPITVGCTGDLSFSGVYDADDVNTALALLGTLDQEVDVAAPAGTIDAFDVAAFFANAHVTCNR